jgi:uncharacterized protein (TIGR02145 family)
MKRIIYFFILILIVFGCKTEEPQNPPTVITNSASDVSIKVATLNGEVTNEGFSATTDRGFVYSEKNTNPSISDTKVQSGYGKGIYSTSLDNLLANTKYYYKAYAINKNGSTYGAAQNFTTADYNFASLSTGVPENISFNSFYIQGNISNEGGGSILESGFVVGTNTLPTINELKFPVTKGKTTLALVIGKLNINTKYFVRSYAINEKGVSYGNERNLITLNVNPVTSKTGRIWMDRNLGASQVATSSTDQASYGDLYQWGRPYDGHQIRTSATTNVTSSLDVPGNSSFILGLTPPTWDWRIPQNANLWQGVNGINNVCPTGYRIPTSNEWEQEIATWSSKNSNGAFLSPLKLTIAGKRQSDDGSLSYVGYEGYYWSSTLHTLTIGFEPSLYAKLLFFDTGGNASGGGWSSSPSMGNSVRCIKD